MKITKLQFYKVPELYLIALVILAGYTPPLQLNPIALVIAFILIFQVIFQNNIAGKIITGAFVLLKIFMVFAFISELNDLILASISPAEFLLGGLFLFGLNAFICSLMINRYNWIPNRMENSGEPRNPSDS